MARLQREFQPEIKELKPSLKKYTEMSSKDSEAYGNAKQYAWNTRSGKSFQNKKRLLPQLVDMCLIEVLSSYS